MAVNSPTPKIPTRPKLPDKSRWDASSNPKAPQKEKSLGETAQRFLPKTMPAGASTNPLAGNTSEAQAVRALTEGEFGQAFEKGLQAGGEYAGKAIGAYLGGNVGGKIGGEIGKRLMSGKKGKFIFFLLIGGSCLNFLVMATLFLLPLILLIVIIAGAVMLLVFGGPIALCVAGNQAVQAVVALLRNMLPQIVGLVTFATLPPAVATAIQLLLGNLMINFQIGANNIINNIATLAPANASAAIAQARNFVPLIRTVMESLNTLPENLPGPNLIPPFLPPLINYPVRNSVLIQGMLMGLEGFITQLTNQLNGAQNLVNAVDQVRAICTAAGL